MMFFHYIVLCSFFVFVVAWIMVRAFQENNLPPDTDEGPGGPGDTNLPIVDLPPGSTISDWLTDKWPDKVRERAKAH